MRDGRIDLKIFIVDLEGLGVDDEEAIDGVAEFWWER